MALDAAALLLEEVKALQRVGATEEDFENLALALNSAEPEALLGTIYQNKQNRILALMAIPAGGIAAPTVEAYNELANHALSGGEAQLLGGLGAMVVASGTAAWRILRARRKADRKYKALVKIVQRIRGSRPQTP
jgi:hypothetical protein